MTTNVHVENAPGRPEWFALYVTTGKEKNVANILAEKGFETYLPLRQHPESRRAKRKQTVALFPSYCFCRLDVNDRSSMVVTTPHVYGFVTCAKRRATVPDRDINSIRQVESTELAVEVMRVDGVSPGERTVRIHSGPFSGLFGKIIKQRGRTRFVLEIEAVQQCLIVEVDSEWLQLD